MSPDTYDSGYKLLYSHGAMVRDLLAGFVPGDWIDQLDFTSLEKCSGSYISDDLRDRADDLIWRVRWGPRWLYVYLLLEFQSRIDPWMAVRIQTYIGLLYQDLIRTEQLSAGGRLPPVLPLVLYNGATPWSAAREMEPLVEPGPLSLAPYRPRQGYLVLDERRLAAESSAPERNLSAALFRLEASRTPADVMAIVQQLIDWLQAPEQTSLRRAFAVWFGRVFLPRRLPSVSMPPMTDLFEVQHMLNDGIETWTDQWKKEGLQEGLKQGEARILLRQLSIRFGTLPPEIREKIETADAETLLQWSERILDAESLDDVVH
jgi:hypothetical protein